MIPRPCTPKDHLQRIRAAGVLPLDESEKATLRSFAPTQLLHDRLSLQSAIKAILDVLHLDWAIRPEEIDAILNDAAMLLPMTNEGRLFKLAELAKNLYYQLHPTELDTLEAFVALGGNADRTGHVDAFLINNICGLHEVMLPDLPRLLRMAKPTNGKGAGRVATLAEVFQGGQHPQREPISYTAFSQLFRSEEDDDEDFASQQHGSLRGDGFSHRALGHSGGHPEPVRVQWADSNSKNSSERLHSPRLSFRAVLSEGGSFQSTSGDKVETQFARAMQRKLHQSIQQHTAACAGRVNLGPVAASGSTASPRGGTLPAFDRNAPTGEMRGAHRRQSGDSLNSTGSDFCRPFSVPPIHRPSPAVTRPLSGHPRSLHDALLFSRESPGRGFDEGKQNVPVKVMSSTPKGTAARRGIRPHAVSTRIMWMCSAPPVLASSLACHTPRIQSSPFDAVVSSGAQPVAHSPTKSRMARGQADQQQLVPHEESPTSGQGLSSAGGTPGVTSPVDMDVTVDDLPQGAGLPAALLARWLQSTVPGHHKSRQEPVALLNHRHTGGRIAPRKGRVKLHAVDASAREQYFRT
eukprot:GGOE01014129.1.p1 GENE.GGOE01014129.1~~GGOE01014129.1.p1  ORF type:complete len:578 (+),score=74.47 GGOE01014129.1:77-1810(+)